MKTFSLGSEGEDLAVRFLKKKGYVILERNYKNVIGEIDIVARDGNTMVFVEVKTRANNTFGYPFEAVTRNKIRKIKNLALLYLKKHKKEFPVRFDVVSIFRSRAGAEEIEHIKDAFEV